MDTSPIGWFLLCIVSSAEESRTDEAVLHLAAALKARGDSSSNSLDVVLLGASVPAAPSEEPTSDGEEMTSLEELRLQPGGRHDNDHADYRSIGIMITSDEALCRRQPFLPHRSDHHLSASPEAALLDMQFRLLREEMVGPLRSELQVLGLLPPTKPELPTQPRQPGEPASDSASDSDDSRLSLAPSTATASTQAGVATWRSHLAAGDSEAQPLQQRPGQQRNVFGPVGVEWVQLRPRPCVMVSFALPPSHPAAKLPKQEEREAFWANSGKATLPLDGSVCFARNGNPVLFATVVRREPRELAMPRPTIGLAFHASEAELVDILTCMGSTLLAETSMVQIASNSFGIQPVLRALQGMQCIPLAEELVHGRPPLPISYLPADVVEEELAARMDLDASQLTAMRQALTHRVSLTQGPPGTGKTYMGVLVCDIIVRRTEQTILCVCHTNHALDQFLEALLDEGITSVVRIGGGSKSERLGQYNINELRSSAQQGRRSSAEVAREFRLKEDLLQLQGCISQALDRVAAHNSLVDPPAAQLRQQQQQSLLQRDRAEAALARWEGRRRAGWSEPKPVALAQPPPSAASRQQWLNLGRYLRTEHPQAWRQLCVEGLPSSDSQFQRWLKGNAYDAPYKVRTALATRDQAAGSRPGRGSSSSSTNSSSRGSGSGGGGAVGMGVSGNNRMGRRPDGEGGGSGKAGQPGSLNLSLWQLSKQDRRMQLLQWAGELVQLDCERLAGHLQQAARLKQEIRSLQDGQFEQLLAGARVIGCTTTGAAKHKELLGRAKVGVVMVEEAAEILEAHILTSLSAYTQHLIMIGDHKQLRPQRLVLSGFPHASLAVQHRMRPEISALIRHTYPALEDHPSVLLQPPARGLTRSVVFIDHRQPELQERCAGAFRQEAQALSKVNMHEVGMVVAMVRYLFQQGYDSGQMVVLTPYLGQLLELQRALSPSFEVLVDELDMRDLRKAVAGVSLPQVARKPRSVRVATIDNYQGEEADIVVASLVRSNTTGSVGFLGEPERMNVLLSRPRHAIITIGNSDTLRHARSHRARKHLGTVVDLFEQAGALVGGLPAQCQLHGLVHLPQLCSPGDFLERSPDGGCSQRCSQKLPCGHSCALRCHAFDREHVFVRCGEQVHGHCSEGHLIQQECWVASWDCLTCQEIQKLKESEKQKLFEINKAAALARGEAELQKVAANADIARLRQELSAVEESQAARFKAVLQEGERKKLAKELKLQETYGATELAVREAQAREETSKQIEAMELEAAESAAAQAQQALARETDAAEKKELARLGKEIDAHQRQLKSLDVNAHTLDQRHQDKQRSLLARTGKAVESVTVAADQTSVKYKQVSTWKQHVGGATTEAGLQALKFQLAACTAAGSAGEEADTLDVVFDTPGLGRVLLDCTSAKDQTNIGSASYTPLKRGLGLLQDRKWLDAYDYFNALSTSTTASAPPVTGIARALAQLCKFKLGQGQPPAAAAAATTTTANHLIDALSLDTQACATTPARSLTEQRRLDARATGQALAYLLHPDVVSQQLPKSLSEEVQQVLARRAAALQGLALSPREGSAGNSPREGGAAELARWLDKCEDSKSLTQMMQLTGLGAIKREMFNLYDQVLLDKERKRDLQSKQYNIRFYGNPGTGKTTVARHYAALLTELGVLPKAGMVETSGAALVNGGLRELKGMLEVIKEGGVLFIDEAYQLNPKLNPQGAQVLDYLLPEMENKRGTLVVVLAGYQEPMEALMAYNEGLPSRFPLEYTFADYTDAELCIILNGVIAADTPTFRLQDPRHAVIAAQRLGRMRGTFGFGNARAARNLYEATLTRQSARVIRQRQQGLKPETMLLEREDLLGPMHIDHASSKALRELSVMQGLGSVKASVDSLLQIIRTNAEREELGKPVQEVCLNRVFLGNPGTGKTTVASIYGRILSDLGLLSNGQVVVKNPSDFLGSVLGGSEKNTAAILDATRGKVLVIDEAYGLHSKGTPDPFKTAVIDTIVAMVQGIPGDDRCVLLLGYPGQMEVLMREANPGLARRFQLKNAWVFDDYNDEESMSILRTAALRAYGWDLDFDVARAAIKVLAMERRGLNYGNAGAINNLLSAAALSLEARTKHLPASQRAALGVPLAVDFDPQLAAVTDPAAIFQDLVGCTSVLEKLKEYQATITASQQLGKDPLDSFELNFLFVGSPGTGKTTVARRVGQLFKSLRLLASDEVVECSAKDFTTGYVGQASGKTREMFDQGVGKVLFIDEAYMLNPWHGGPFALEALNEIVQILTEPRYMNKMVVVMAGYEEPLEKLMQANPGLKSRFSEKLRFPDFGCADACKLFERQIDTRGLDMTEETRAGLPWLMDQLIAAPGWANGRDIVNWSKRSFQQYAQRTQDKARTPMPPDSEGYITLPDLRLSLSSLLSSKTEAPPTKPPPTVLSLENAFNRPAFEPQDFALPPLPPNIAPAAPVVAPPAEVSPGWDSAHPAALGDGSFDESSADSSAEPATEVSADAGVAEEGVCDDITPPPLGGFGGLSNGFLAGVQASLEKLEYDLTSADIMSQLVNDSSLPERLLASLAGVMGGGMSGNELREMVRQWQQALAEQLELERQLATRKLRPVWRCAACGRYGCPVAPYIESYQEFD
ncbi:MAG: hypothetical protein WDW36_003575 [Sanguina aurantia]